MNLREAPARLEAAFSGLSADQVQSVSQLLSSAAHEIRNPIAALIWNLEELQERHSDDSQTFEMILSELRRMDATLSRILSLTKGTVSHFQTVNPLALIQTTLGLMAGPARQSKVEFVVEPTTEEIGSMLGDESQLMQVFMNLVINAIDAMPHGGRLVVRLSRDGDSQLCISFQDTGTGIAPEVLPRLGEPFFTTKPHGTGIGLVVCQRIVKEHDGTMEIESRLGVGTTVEVTLPIRA